MDEIADAGSTASGPSTSKRRRTVTVGRDVTTGGGDGTAQIRSSRRGFVRMAAAATAGAAAAVVVDVLPASAATSAPLNIGVVNSPTLVGDSTILECPSPTNLMVAALQVRNYSGTTRAPDANFRAAIFASSSDVDAGAGYRFGVMGDATPFADANKQGIGVCGSANIVVLQPTPAYPVGVYGIVTADGSGNGIGVVGDARGAATGVSGTSASGTGVSGAGAVYGVAGSSAAVGGVGVRALSNNGIGLVATGLDNAINATSVGAGAGINATGVNGVIGNANNTGDGVSGTSTSGRGVLATSGSGDGVRGVSGSGRAVVARSTSNIAVSAESTSGLDLDCNGTGRVRVKPQGGIGAPSSGAYAAGEMILDSVGDLYSCVAAGTPGNWHRIGATATATASGAFRPVDPFRAYDSRQAGYADHGVLTIGSNRVVSVKDAHATDGTLTNADVVPVGASAVTLNLTIVSPTSVAGFLAVTPGDATTFVASSINWSSAGAVLANGGVAKIDGNRQIKVFSGGAGGTIDFVVDVTGFYT